MAIWQVVWKQRFLGQECRNVLHYEGPQTSLSGAELAELSDQVRSDWVNQVGVANQSNDWSLYGTNIRRVDEAGWPSVDVGFTSGTLTGTATNESLPSQVAMLAHGVAIVLKPNRVRTYLTGLVENHLVDGYWHAAAMTARLNLIQAVDAFNVGSQAWQRVAVAWDINNTYVVDYNVLSSYFISNVPATQRRRRIGRGS